MMILKSVSKTFFAPIFIILLAIVSGCSSAPKHDPEFAPSMPVYKDPIPQEVTGGIYRAGQEIMLFEDLKARRIGDTITVKLSERTNATKSADTEASRSQETTIANPTLYGVAPQFNVPLVSNDNTLAAQLSSSNEFDGSGKSSQSNSLTGDITVTVADVFPNGNMYVRGEKRLNFNQGNEYVKIAGIVRPYDIGPDNTVLSTKLADATIMYNGDGVVADANKIGWLARFFIGVISPF